MTGAGITFEIAIALTFWAFCFVCGLCIAADIISRICRQRPCEDEADELAHGDLPHLAPDVLTSFHGIKSTAEEQAGNV
jgi:hypothetical protein